ncbi:CPBP family intramembrane glutamic endopeptidase [Brevibacillus dissolubilis]|uniref:CPBP family intramembrane glutamic endopeptidase n=1 Tax=Brevibacillus dissolubilis TaxID=1844116 RepID=UPI00111696A0|nr:CPBP family intramembrane glutamic endopeptidase [Brevibacillus dissolubilis]
MKTFKIVGAAIGYLLVYLLVMTVTTLLIRALVHDPAMKQFIRDNMVVVLLLANCLALLVYSVLFRLRGQNLFTFTGFVKTDRQTVMLVIPAGLSLGVSIFAVAHLNAVSANFPGIVQLTETVGNGGNLLLMILGSVLMGSLLEEILFRGILLQTFHKRFSLAVSIGLQALLFGLMLMNLPLVLFAALGAVVYGLVRVWGASMWASLITHMVSTTTLIVLYQVQGGSLSQTVIGSLLAVGVILLSACLWTLNRHAKRGSYAESQFNGS